jgi:hypothetical protein
LSTILGLTNVVFQWSAGVDVAEYQLTLSTVAAGDSELYSYKGTAHTATVPTLPENGLKVYARLYSDINGVWQHNDYVYTESGFPIAAELISPEPGTALGASNVVFQWLGASDASEYQLNLSAVAFGDSDLFSYKGTATTVTVPTLPAKGVTVYARLYSLIDGVWYSNGYFYTEQ